MTEEYQYGDVVVHFCESVGGRPAKFVITAFDSDGGCALDLVSSKGELLAWGRMMYPGDPSYIRVGRWDFDRCMEEEEEAEDG